MNNCELSDWEDITLSTDSNNPTIMNYDGFIYVSASRDAELTLSINGRSFNYAGRASWVTSFMTAAVNKGDSVYATTTESFTAQYGKFYKKRDYSNR